MNNEIIIEFYKQIEVALDGILNFWIDRSIDEKNGGFLTINKDNEIVENEDKNVVLTARILWTYSAAFRQLNNDKYLQMADRAYHYLREKFIDTEYGGTFSILDFSGRPVDSSKQVYAESFVIYGLSEYHMATGNQESLDLAVSIFTLLDTHAHENKFGGYIDSLEREWTPMEGKKLGNSSIDAEKTLRSNMHIFEAYINLFKVWKDERLAIRLRELIEIMQLKVIDIESGGLGQLFSMDWNKLCDTDSFGDDMESSWLLCDGADLLDDDTLLQSVKMTSLKIAKQILEKGLDNDYGGIFHGIKQDVLSTNKEWWVQAEAINGFLNAYLLTNKEIYFEAALSCWRFIQKNVIAPEGEWFWNTTREGAPYLPGKHGGPKKCPYHNGRMCLRTLSILEQFIK